MRWPCRAKIPSAQSRSDAWNDYYRPHSPAAHHLVNECVRATLQSDRLAAFQAASLASQMQDAKHAWLEQRREQVARHVERLRVDPRGGASGSARDGRRMSVADRTLGTTGSQSSNPRRVAESRGGRSLPTARRRRDTRTFLARASGRRRPRSQATAKRPEPAVRSHLPTEIFRDSRFSRQFTHPRQSPRMALETCRVGTGNASCPGGTSVRNRGGARARGGPRTARSCRPMGTVRGCSFAINPKPATPSSSRTRCSCRRSKSTPKPTPTTPRTNPIWPVHRPHRSTQFQSYQVIPQTRPARQFISGTSGPASPSW